MTRDIPAPELLDLIREHAGEITGVRPAFRGNTSTTFLVDSESGAFFVKGARNKPGGHRDSLIREELINPYVVPLSPALRWRAENEAWIVLGFDEIHGRPAGFQPGSPDLPTVINIINQISGIPLPEIARDWPETRWDRFASSTAEARLFAGDSLLYTDINPDNFLIGDHESWAVDWAWPTRGAAFIDPACLVVQLIATGHSAAAAEALATGCTAWTSADPSAIDAFATATRRIWEERADRQPEAAWLKAMTAA